MFWDNLCSSLECEIFGKIIDVSLNYRATWLSKIGEI